MNLHKSRIKMCGLQRGRHAVTTLLLTDSSKWSRACRPAELQSGVGLWKLQKVTHIRSSRLLDQMVPYNQMTYILSLSERGTRSETTNYKLDLMGPISLRQALWNAD